MSDRTSAAWSHRPPTRRSPRGAGALAALLLGVAMGAAAAPTPHGQIGAIVPDSWPDKARGEEIRNGMLLALKTWPGQSPPALVIKDSACDPKKAAAAAQELIDAKVDLIVGAWCVLGTVPRQARDAGIPFVSANAERYAGPPEGSLQMGSIPINLANTIAARLRSEVGLRVTATSACWIDFDARVPDGFEAALCPTLPVDSARWDEVAPAYSAAYRKPFSIAAARGYAAMQAALVAFKQVRSSARPAGPKTGSRDIETLLGVVRQRDERATPDDSMLLVFAPKLPRLAAREARALDEMMKSKGCGCAKGGSCPPSATWSALPFAVQCSGAPVVLRKAGAP
ncbi:MAG TPA: ABC transporter substrate-binding protein [Albitalea sp.]